MQYEQIPADQRPHVQNLGDVIFHTEQGPRVSGFFKKYGGASFDELEAFAKLFALRIVDRYWTYHKSVGCHIPCIEVCAL